MNPEPICQDEQPTGLQIGSWPAFPPGVEVADEVDQDAEDPALTDSGRRQCVTTKLSGGRCGGTPPAEELLCSIHSGRADPAEGARARQRQRQEAKEERERALSLQKLGTRAVVAQVLSEKATEVRQTVSLLLDRASEGDLKAASLLLPWIDQGLGKPTERVEHQLPSDIEGIREADTTTLAAMVAEGRRRRLQAVPAAQPVDPAASESAS